MKTLFAEVDLNVVLRQFADGYLFPDGTKRMPKETGLHDPEIYVDPIKRVVLYRFYVQDEEAK